MLRITEYVNVDYITCERLLEPNVQHMQRNRTFTLPLASSGNRPAPLTAAQPLAMSALGQKRSFRFTPIALIRSARKAINTYFPNMEALRHTSQHAADIFGSPVSFAKHTAGPANFVNHIDGYTVKTVYKKKRVPWDVMDDVVNQLQEVPELNWAGYIAANSARWWAIHENVEQRSPSVI